MQAGPELSDGLKERQIACIEGTMAFYVARMIHTYLYAANRLWDTDRISRLRPRRIIPQIIEKIETRAP